MMRATALLLPLLCAAATCAQPFEPVFREMVELVRAEFCDPAKAEAWAEDVTADVDLLASIRNAKTPAEWGPLARGALARLGTSHTTLYTPADREYAELLDIFFTEPPAEALPFFPSGKIETDSIALLTETIEGRTFVRLALAGGPAARAGLLRGDELLTAGGKPWADVAPFRGKAGEPVPVTLRRAAGGEPSELTITPEPTRPRDAFVRAIREGAQEIERDSVRIVHLPVPSYAGQHYHDAVTEVLASEPFASCDALAFDLRSGWGGASPAYLDLFNPLVPTIGFRPRGADGWSQYTPAWGKPVAMLVDRTTRSGKEILAFAFQKHGVGPIVGETTAGAVVGGAVRMLTDGSTLYLAVGDARIDGVRLEGVGVTPDVVVNDPLPYAAGADRTLDRAVDLLLESCHDAAR